MLGKGSSDRASNDPLHFAAVFGCVSDLALGGGGRRMRVGRDELGGAEERRGLNRKRPELAGGGAAAAAAAAAAGAAAAGAAAAPLPSSPLDSTLDPSGTEPTN